MATSRDGARLASTARYGAAAYLPRELRRTIVAPASPRFPSLAGSASVP